MGKMRCVICKKNDKVSRHGKFRRSSDCKTIQRFHCKRCHKTYSTATTDPAFSQKKRRINDMVFKLLTSGVSMRGIARTLNVHPETVKYRLVFLAEKYRKETKKTLDKLGSVEEVQFDELITFEHTNLCLILSIIIRNLWKIKQFS